VVEIVITGFTALCSFAGEAEDMRWRKTSQRVFRQTLS